MRFELNEDQAILEGLVDRFVADRYDLARRRMYLAERVGFSAGNWRLLAETGLLALPFASSDGGLDGGPIEIITVMQSFGRGLVVEPMLTDVLLAGALLARAGTLAQKAHWLPRIFSGAARVVLAHFEHSARFDLVHVETRAREGASGIEIDGTKTFVPAAMGADAYLVSARSRGATAEEAGIRLYLVQSDAPGIERRDYRMIDGSLASEIRFSRVRAVCRLKGGIGDLLAVAENARLGACAEMVGIMSLLFETTLDYLRTRKQFGVLIGSFQAVQHRMVDVYLLLEQSRAHLFRAARSSNESVARSAAIAGAKSYISTSAVKLGEECIQFHGGIGMSDELVIGHGHKRIVLLAAFLGDADTELERYVSLIA